VKALFVSCLTSVSIVLCSLIIKLKLLIDCSFNSAAEMAEPESSRSIPEGAYDVFLSFRGEDTRKTFTDHLYVALYQAGIHTFRDDDELPRGEEISEHLLEAIRESKISIVVFSKGYASSRWCLNELIEILKCKRKKTGQIVLPIFYDIDPSDVRKQTGSFADAFVKHEDCFEEKLVKEWRKALEEAGNLSGWNLNDMANGYAFFPNLWSQYTLHFSM